jgi:hypothetical protein
MVVARATPATNHEKLVSMRGVRLARREPRWLLARFLLVALAVGCSSSAAIQRRTGPDVVGIIDAADADRLYVTADEGQRYAIERRDVVGIDHPGRNGKIVGGISTGIGLGFLTLGLVLPDNCPPDAVDCLGVPAAARIAGLTALGVGLPIWISGLVSNHRSRAAAEPVPSAGAPNPP